MPKVKTNPKRVLYRPEEGKMIAGVCAGIADYFDIDPVIIRAILVAITIFGGSGLLLYIILWIVMPSESSVGKDSEENIRENVEEIKVRAKRFAGKDRNIFLGVIFLIIGFSFLLNNFGVINPWVFSKLWPLVIILLGVMILTRNERK